MNVKLLRILGLEILKNSANHEFVVMENNFTEPNGLLIKYTTYE